MTSNQVFENCQVEKSHWKINHIVTTEYIILAWNQHSIFIFHYFNAKTAWKILSNSSLKAMRQLSNFWPNQFQNNVIWPSNTAGISLDSRLEYSKITHRYAKVSPFTWFLCSELPLIQILSTLSVVFTRLWLKCQRVCWWASCTAARHAGSFDCLMTSLILITMDNGRGHCAYWQSCKVPNQTHRGMEKIGKCML